MTHTDNTALRAVVVAVSLGALGACASDPARDPAYASVPPPSQAVVQVNPGAIYQPNNGLSLYENLRARRIGDTLTVRLTESTNASKTAATKTKKETDVAITNPTLLGRTRGNYGTTINSEQEFTGEGSSSQSNTLSGNITVTVIDILANGNLSVRGEKILRLNQGDEHIKVAGIVRPSDILSDNSILSTQLADATIQYAGAGVTDDANRMGWASRFFNSKWWPF